VSVSRNYEEGFPQEKLLARLFGRVERKNQGDRKLRGPVSLVASFRRSGPLANTHIDFGRQRAFFDLPAVKEAVADFTLLFLPEP
jgi:hypothetical protein